MLQELKVSQFAIIDHLHIEFQNGLNILSGETGSGKSVLLKSLALLMGDKASSEIVRSGSQHALVEGSFDLSQRQDIQEALQQIDIDCSEKKLIVKRLIAANDKSKIYLNGSLCTLNQLREIVSPMIELTGHTTPLIEMTGQHDNRNLLSKNYHLDMLDQFAGHLDKRHLFETQFEIHNKLKIQIQNFEKQSQEKSQKLDFLKFQILELDKLQIDPATDSELENEIKELKNSHKILKFVEECESLLFSDQDSVTSRIQLILKKSIDLSSLSSIQENRNSLEQAQQMIEDSFYTLRKQLNSDQFDEDSLEEKESRLSQIRKMQKKYGPDLNVICDSYLKMKQEISELENSDLHLEKLKKQVLNSEKELNKLAEELHQRRLKFAIKLADSVNKELLDLNMKGVAFDIQVEKLTSLNVHGFSDIEYLCQISAKDPKRPIAKVASGGELSRILLSLKRSVGQSDFPRTYLFDEVDTGVSGNTAEKVGRKLKSIAIGQQVICVTHLPQVAACGDVHFSIQKSNQKDSVTMNVEVLKGKSRIEEIARLISGEKITKTSLAHAEQLLSENRD